MSGGDLWEESDIGEELCQIQTVTGPQRKRWSRGAATLRGCAQAAQHWPNTGDTMSYLQPPSAGCSSSLQLSSQASCSHQGSRTLPTPNLLSPRTSGEKKAKGKGRQRDRHVRFALHSPLGSCMEALKGRGFGQLKLCRSCSFLGSRGWAQRQRREQPQQSQLPTQGAAQHG